jgi:hypothetical protein
MGAAPSSPETPSSQASPASICKFSEEQISILDKKIRDINEFSIQFKTKPENFYDYNKFVEEQSLSKTEVKPPPSVKKVQLLGELVNILNEYKTILKITTELCEKYQRECVEDIDVENDIDKLILKNMSQAQTHFNEFLRKIEIPDDNLKEPIDILKKIIEVGFSNVDVIKSEMKTMCAEQKRIAEKKRMGNLFSMKGGKSSRTRSKKRKQMKMKMKGSNSLSKTRNNKKKYNNGKCVKK